MAIRPTDAYRLWGRAGGRCSICRIPLTLLEFEGTLGEIAHIVAKSTSGPRGNSSLNAQERDSYSNLVLLCPNHHTEVDRQAALWPIEKLHEIKALHEQWVQEQIDRGHLVLPLQRAEPFRNERIAYWSQRSQAWSYASLTPLELDDAAMQAESLEIRHFIETLQLPEWCSVSSRPNSYHIETSANGWVAEDFGLLAEGKGYRIEVFRTGHAEIAICLDSLINLGAQLRSSSRTLLFGGRSHRLDSCEHLLPYFEYVRFAEFQVTSLARLWSELRLPFKNMVLTLAVIGLPRLCLVVSNNWDSVSGRPLEVREVTHAVVAEGPDVVTSLLEVTLGRILNAFGFVLQGFRDASGQHIAPVTLNALR